MRGANPFAVAFHRDAYLFEGVTGTEELYEALRKNGFSVALRIAIGGVGSASTNGHVTSSGCVLGHGLWVEA